MEKFYSVLQNAAVLAEADGNSWYRWASSHDETWDSKAGLTDTSKDFLEKYLLPYISYRETKQVDTQYYIYLYDGSYFSVYKLGCLDFCFDTNGEKRPNERGKDTFFFLYCPTKESTFGDKGRVSAYYNIYTTSREKALSQCKADAQFCSGLLFMDGWEFKKDYPYNI